MIHLLEVSPEIEPKELKKLSRRYAMTGGYELALKDGLEQQDLMELVKMYGEQLVSYEGDSSERRSCNAYRILQLVHNSRNSDDAIRKMVDQLLSMDSNG